MALTPLILLPGTLCDAALFAPVVAALADIADCRVGDVARSAALAEVAQDILSAAPPTFALAGLSYGGIVALEIMRQAPERVTRLALLNTTPHLPSVETRQRLALFLEMANAGAFRAITTDHLKDTMLHPAHQRNMALRREVLAMAERIGFDGFVNQVTAQLDRPDSTPTLAGISCPTLVLTGRQDTLCTVHIHEMMAAQIPNARLVIVEECGHLSPLEQPAHVSRALREWLTG